MNENQSLQEFNAETARAIAEAFSRTGYRIITLLGERDDGQVVVAFGENSGPEDFFRVIKIAVEGINKSLNEETPEEGG